MMLLHAALRWPEMADVSLWLMALSHAVFFWNNTPYPDTGLSPIEIFWVPNCVVTTDSLIDEMVGPLRTWKTISQLTLVGRKDAKKINCWITKGLV